MLYDVTLFVNVYSVFYTSVDYKLKLTRDPRETINRNNNIKKKLFIY